MTFNSCDMLTNQWFKLCKSACTCIPQPNNQVDVPRMTIQSCCFCLSLLPSCFSGRNLTESIMAAQIGGGYACFNHVSSISKIVCFNLCLLGFLPPTGSRTMVVFSGSFWDDFIMQPNWYLTLSLPLHHQHQFTLRDRLKLSICPSNLHK